jgi:hypothetical protein
MNNKTNSSLTTLQHAAAAIMAALMIAIQFSTRTVPGTTCRLLTRTSKMPGPSWSLPAGIACPRANGSICESCYAQKGCYIWDWVKRAQMARFKWTVESLKTDAGLEQWVKVMVTAIRRRRCTYFRVHDSGDMFSARYADAWYLVCLLLPEVKFWIPTRAWQQPAGPLPIYDPLLNTLRKLASLPNVTVRPSALNFGDYAPQIDGLHAGSTAGMPDLFRTYQCHARANGGHCGECRVCWDVKDLPVNYPKH